VFDRFYQSENQTAPNTEGTGIGLALVRELIELHGGDVSVVSAKGKGSSFIIRVPLVQQELSVDEMITPQPETDGPLAVALAGHEAPDGTVHRQPAVHEMGFDGDALHILLVEDNTEVRTFIHDLLAEKGYVVSEAADGRKGLESAFENVPDLIITDVMMPVMDGFAFSREIRSDIRTSHIPIIMLTARAEEEDRIQGLETGVDHYLTKPVSSRELLVRISNLIAQRELLRERFSTMTTAAIRPSEVSAIPMDQAFLEHVMQTVVTNLGEPNFGVESLAENVHMSVKNLTRKLNALLGYPPGQLIRSTRLQHAAELLERNAATVTDVAYDVGFTVPENFSRSFKKHFGVTPSEYARGERNEDST
jgi:DNA-binding response OmpR family regulator